jgi:hypothetical protein
MAPIQGHPRRRVFPAKLLERRRILDAIPSLCGDARTHDLQVYEEMRR